MIDLPSPGLWEKFRLSTVTSFVMLGIYTLINRNVGEHHFDLTMPEWVPFRPEFTPVYLGMLLTTWLLPLAIRDYQRFMGCIGANVLAFCMVMPWWILLPTHLARPPLPENAGVLYKWLIAIDGPYNVSPCAHGIGPLVATWFVWQERPLWRIPLVCWLAVGLASIAIVWQHRPLDILLGELLGFGAIGALAGLYKKHGSFWPDN